LNERNYIERNNVLVECRWAEGHYDRLPNLFRMERSGNDAAHHSSLNATASCAFIAAALTHFGVLIGGDTHLKAGVAESVIGIVLVAGLVFITLWPASAYAAAIAAQSFALLSTAVGLFTIAIGVGPQTALDLVPRRHRHRARIRPGCNDQSGARGCQR
jgi:hypothetical protein